MYGYKPVRAAKQYELKRKDAASGTEGITLSSVNYLRHLMTLSRFGKKSSKHFHDILCI